MSGAPRPYGSSARAYLAAGYWPLPLPPRKKASPPGGYTGRDGRQVEPADVDRWIAEHRCGNIGLRLPRGVAGVDVDAYKDDQHLAAWEELTARCGPLPDAPWCSSRDDGISGVRLFRVPEDWEAGGKLPEGRNGVSPGEVIQWHHRYVVCPPSIHPATGRAYRWRSGSITRVADLPALSRPWLDALSAATVPAPPRAHPATASRTADRAGGRPGDDFNERADWLTDILGPHGWELHHETGGTLYVTRPGKSKREGHSATIGHSNDGVERLYVFSADAAPFEMETPYTKFAAYTLLNHGGNYQSAARELGRIGYGEQLTPEAAPEAGAPSRHSARPRGFAPRGGGGHPLKVLSSLCETVRKARAAGPDMLYWAACRAWEHVDHGLFPPDAAQGALLDAARQVGVADSAALATIASARRMTGGGSA
jgi:Bifunctional DNA primase/polymerase, N-terminal